MSHFAPAPDFTGSSDSADSLDVANEPHSQPAPISQQLPRPGLKGASWIVLGVVLIHLVCSSAYLVATHPELTTQNHPDNPASLIERLKPGELFRMLAFEQGVFVLTVFALTGLVFGKRFFRAIPFRRPALRHVGLLLLLVLPLTVMDSFLAQTLIEVWESAAGVSPSQGDLPTVLDGITGQSSVVMLLVLLAVMPALGEELVFRGVIGRGLIARRGIVAGVLCTSLLFSIVHLNPVQGVGVFFVGVMCHVAYLATRTIAAPMLLHFLYNALPVFLLKHFADQKAAGGAEDFVSSIPPLMALAAAVCVAALGCLLWKSRVQYFDAEGENLPDEVPTVEAPPEAERERCRPVAGSWAAVAGVAYLLFLVSSSLAVPS